MPCLFSTRLFFSTRLTLLTVLSLIGFAIADIRVPTKVAAQFPVQAPPQRAGVIVRSSTGNPYGIASIELPLPAPIVGQAPAPITITDDSGRILFPISNDIRVKLGRPSEQPIPRPGKGRLLGRFGKLLREIVADPPQIEQTIARRVTFLVSR